MIVLCLLALFPAFVLSKSVASADFTEVQVCQYFDARIQRFEEKVKEMIEYVDVDSEFYRTLEGSRLCDTVGRVAVPECVANHEGNECVAAKIESIKKPLLRAIKVDKSGKEFFDHCKYIGYKNVLKTFYQTRKLMSGECGLPGQKLSGDRESRNSLLLPLLVAGAYDPSSIWFQYFLCKDQQIYCYFFTQGWNQYEYGQYYLYENLLDDTNGIFGGSTDSSNLATLALLGGLGGGSPHSGWNYPQPSGYSQVPAAQGRKRRQSDDELCEDGNDACKERKHRSNSDECLDSDELCEQRKRRSNSDVCPEGDEKCKQRMRRSNSDVCPQGDEKCKQRKRRSNSDVCPEGDEQCKRKFRSNSDVCPEGDEQCKRKRRSNSDCLDGDEQCKQRKRRGAQRCSDPDDDFCCEKGMWVCI